MKEIKTNDGKKGGWLVGKRHYDKSGKPLGGIKAIVTDAGGKPVELEGGEVIINREASKKHWKELSRINQSAGGGVAIGPPSGVDEDPEDNYEHGGKIDFNPNHIPNKWILSYAKNIKEKYPEIWKLGGNIFGNEAFKNLKRVAERGHWLDSEEWMYVKWRAYVARHQRDYRIEGVIAMLKWVDKVEKGWPYMKQLIEEKIKKIESKKKGWKHKMKEGGDLKTYSVKKELGKIIVYKNGERYGYIFTRKEWDSKKKKDNPIVCLKRYSDDKIFTSNYGFQQDAFKYIKDTGELFFNENEFKTGGRTITQTPAPKEDRIKGSDVNKPGSSASTKSASSIKFDESTIESIKSKVKEHNQKHPDKKITLASAKAVVRRGMGAYSSSHRPTITGGKPNSRNAWGLARLNAFTYKIVHGKSKSGKYKQDDDLINELGYSVSKYHLGGDMTKHLAPNGKLSNLTHEQWHLVRTPEFKAWFGDWENDPKNASKVVDENGEPLIVYHGSTEKFYIFDDKKIGQRFKVDEKGFFFTNDKQKANIYAKNGFIYSVFLNIKKPLIEEISTGEPIYYWDSNKGKILNKIKNNDGIIIDSIISLYEIENNQTPKLIIPFNSNQIKLADGTNTTFDGNNPDIRFHDGGLIPASGILLSKDKRSKLDYKKIGNDYEFSVFDGESNPVENYSRVQYKKRSNNKVLMNYNQFVNYLYNEGFIDDKFKNGGELAKGIKTEQEHRKTLEGIASGRYSVNEAIKKTAKDHLKEDPHYYSKLAKMEGKKYADGGLIDAKGQDVNVGDYGYYDGRTKEFVTVNKITDKLVYFTNDQGKYKNADRSNFTKYFTNKNIPKTTQAQQPEPQTQKQYTGVQTGLPSTDPVTWNAEYKVGDRVKVRYNFSNDLGTVDSRGFSTKGFAQVDYFSILNDFIIKEIKVHEDSKRPENPSGKFYLLDSELTWEGKDLEPIGVSTITPQPSKIQEPKLEPTEPIEPIEPVKVQMPIKKKKPFDANADYETLFTSYLEKVTNITTKVSKDVLIKSALYDGKMLIDQILK